MSLQAANRRDDFAAGTAPAAVEIAPACHSLSGSARASSAGGYHYDLGVLPALAADLPWARRVQAVAVAPFPGGRLQTASRLPGRRYFSSERTDLRSPWAARFDFSSERADRRSPWAARFDEQRGRRQAVRDLSRFRGLSRPRLLAFFAARGRSTFLVPTTLRRDAVIGVTSHADAPATPSTSGASGLTADPPHNRARSAGSGAARPADVPALFAVSAANLTGLTGTATSLSSLAPQPRSVPRGRTWPSRSRTQGGRRGNALQVRDRVARTEDAEMRRARRVLASNSQPTADIRTTPQVTSTGHFTPISAHRLRVTSSPAKTPGTATHFPHHTTSPAPTARPGWLAPA